MSGASLFAEIAIVAGLTVAGSWLIWMMATAQNMRREDERAHGDVPHLPSELRGAAIASPGEGADQAAHAQVRTSHIAHDSGATTP